MKDIALNSTARLLVIAFQLINIKLYTSNLTADQLGIYFFWLTVSYSANALLFVPLDYYQQANLSRVRSLVGSARPFLIFNGKLAGIYLFITSLLVVLLVNINFKYAIYSALAATLAYSLYVVQALRNTLNNLEYRTCVSVSFIQESVIKVSFLYLLIQFFDPSELLLLVAWIGSLVLTGCYLSYKTHKYQLFLSSKYHKISAKEVFDFSYPFSIGAVCNWLQLQGYRLVLVPLGFAEEVGLFAALSNVGSAAIGAASLIYSQQFTPLLYKTAGKYTGRYLKGSIAVIFGVAMVSVLFGEFAVKLLTNPSFVEHWKLLLFGVITDGGNLIIAPLVIHITLTGKTKQIISSSLIGVMAMLISFIMIYWLLDITEFSVGVPLLVSQWTVALYMYVLYRIATKDMLLNAGEKKV